MRARYAMWLWVVLGLVAFAPPARPGVIEQRPGENYVAFEAEDYDSMGGTRWRVIDLTTPYNHPNTTPVVPVTPVLLPAGSNASGGAALLQDFAESSPSGTGIVVYKIDFATAGTYRFYIRQSVFQDGHVAGYGNEDSFFRPSDFNVDPTVAYHSGATYTEGTYGWRNDYNYTVSSPGTVEFRISHRETGQSLDRIIFSQTTGLGSSTLDELWNWDKVTDFTNGSSDGTWETAGNWTLGVPAADMLARVGNGQTAALSQPGQVADTLHVGHTSGTLPGDGTLNQTGGDLTVLGSLSIGQNTAGSADVVGTYTATGGTLTVGQAATGRADLYLGRNTAGTDYDAEGTLDLSAVAQFDAYLGKLVLGEVTSAAARGRGAGTLRLADTNNIDAQEIMISSSEMHMQAQLWSEVELGTTNNVQTDLMTVGGSRGRALMSFASSGTLALSGSTGAKADLRIGYCTINTSSSTVGTMDLSGGTFDATLGDVAIGFKAFRAEFDSVSTGTLTFDDGVVTADTITIGDAEIAGDGQEATGTGTLNMNGGSLTAGTVTLGTGTTKSSGKINMTAGDFDVTGNMTGGIGTSTLNIDGGSLDVTGDLKVDYLRVGYDGRTATVTAGGDVEIGASGTLDIGRRGNTASGTTRGTLDLSSADSVTLDLDNLRVGTVGADSPGNTYGTLSLSTTGLNTISATEITVGNSLAGHTPTVLGTVHLGADNVIEANTVYVGRRKAQGEVDIVPGGTLTLSGPGGTKATLRVGYNDTASGSDVARGTLDLSGGTLNATLGELTIGYHDYPWSGTTGKVEAEMTFDAGTVTADTVTVGRGNPPGSGAVAGGGGIGTLNLNGGALVAQTISLGVGGSTRAHGTINLSGGTLTAGSIDDGAGTAVFDWTGGTLHVGTFGFDLLNTGDGILAPGTTPGFTEVFGNYVQGPDATYEVELAGYLQGVEHDFTRVHGTATLDGTLSVLMSPDFQPQFCTSLVILEADELEGEFAVFDTSGAQFANTAMSWELLYDYQEGLVTLHAVPEPATLTLLGLGLAALLRRRRR